ncbi:hypothetical protein AWENTII_001128 [Aspergillus wentii]
MLRKKLPLRIPIHPNIRIQPNWLPAPNISLLALRNQLPQRRRRPQHLRKGGILDLKPIIDAHSVALFRLPGRGDQRERREEGNVVLAQGGGEEVADGVDLVREGGIQVEGGGGG